jgi:hypothetical protein
MGALGLPLMLIGGSVGSLVLSAIYGYAIFYIPFIYINLFVTFGFGALVGLLVGFAAKLGKVRNSVLVVLFG